MDGSFFDESLNGRCLGTGCVVSGSTVSEGNGLVSIECPGWIGAWSSGEGWKWDTNNSEVGIFLGNSYRTKEFFYIVNGEIFHASGANEYTAELRNNSRGWFGDLVEAEARFSAHGAVSCHSNLGG